MAAEDVVADVPAVEEEVDKTVIGNEVIVPGPELKGEYPEKKMKALLKEGGKKGVEIEGAADMGGLAFFVTTVALPEENLDLLVESMKAMNAISDPSEEERKGGAGKLGKILICQTEEYLNVVAYVPTHKSAECNATEWLKHVVDMCMGPSNAAAAPVVNFDGIDAANWAAVSMKKDGEKNIFPLKMRDTGISEGIQYLKRKGLFPDGDDSDDDEMVFGDEDFPSM